jgi:hypothetical protein
MTKLAAAVERPGALVQPGDRCGDFTAAASGRLHYWRLHYWREAIFEPQKGVGAASHTSALLLLHLLGRDRPLPFYLAGSSLRF